MTVQIQTEGPLAVVQGTEQFPYLGFNAEAVLGGAEIYNMLTQPGNPEAIARLPYLIQVTRNRLQQRIAAFLFYVEFKRYVQSVDDEAVAWMRAEAIQNEIRRQIEDLFKTPEQREKDFVERWLRDEGRRSSFRPRLDRAYPNDVIKNLAARQKEANKPHTQGTVAELAAKLGVSKSEVRRLKQDGQLEDALAKLN